MKVHILVLKYTIAVMALLLLVPCSVSASAGDTITHSQDTVIRKRHDIAFSLFHTDKDSVRNVSMNLGILGATERLHGFQLNLMSSFALKEMHGLQIAGLSGIASDMHGVQLSVFSNVSLTPFKGIQLSGVTNISRGVKLGIQASALANISSSYMRGLQMAPYNYADTLNGSQIGVFNVCISHPRGVQIGIVNYSRDTVAHKIGLVNINPKTRVDFIVFGGNSTKINAAFRFRNRSTYNIIGAGTHYMGLDEDFSGSVFYRIGQYFQLSPRWSISGDLGFFHIETFQHNSADKPERLYSLQARLNVDYQINRRLSAFASVGYGDTRYYAHNRKYRERMILEAGLAVAYDRSRVKDRPVMYETFVETGDSSSIYAFNNPANMKKRPWKAALETFGINVFVNGFDRYVLNEDFAKISFSSVKENIKNGFVWDNDQFSTNLFAHPYHGGLYFNAARSNGMNFWESVPYSFGGSLMWEIACEIEPPAINDLIATTIGGICIGEITHRISNLVYDDRDRGFSRFMREFAGTVICPIRGFNRIVSGDAWRVRHDYYKYHDYSRIPVDFTVTVGDRYLADDGGLFRGEHNPFIDLLLSYGDAFNSEENKPYSYFTANLTFGLTGNQPLISSVHLLGKLWSVNFYDGDSMSALFGFFQHFNYYDSEAVKDGTSRIPFKISEAASFGPGLIYRFPKVGNMGSMEQRLFVNGILLGGSLSDYYNVIDRNYNMGSGFSAKAQTLMEFPRFGRFMLNADFYRIFTWKGYESKDLTTTDPLFLNAQGDKSSATLLVVTPRLQVYLKNNWSLDILASYYMRETKYKYYDDVNSDTFEVRMGISYSF
ncbi:MAG: DUF3943 domain-containing protein [Prevotellaceae bacterium]|nr:DUF3943 domain-containing protein [Prevotellaceae bacterium]